MNLLSLLKDYATYNLWANKQLVDWLKTKPLNIMDSEIPSSFPSLKLTLLHIWNVQKWWLGTLQQSQPESAYGQVFSGTLEDVFDGIVKQSEEFVQYVDSLTELSLQEPRSFSIPTVGDFTRTTYEIVQHSMNHSTYHRGQIVTIGRNVGLSDAPMTDYMFYLLMAK